jgi:hypothetical protein
MIFLEILMTEQLSPSEVLTYSTVRIECKTSNTDVSIGTAFFFEFLKDGNKSVPVLVTNKHVIASAVEGRFLLHSADSSGSPSPGSVITVKLDNFEQRWIEHPNQEIDLCIMPVAPLFVEAKKQARQPFHVSLDPTLIPTIKEMQDLTALEDIIMIGYPIGIWDSKNNMPVVRRGITATHAGTDYEGRQEFMIDAACFPGSSGSPVFLFNSGSYTTKTGSINIGSRIKLLGILYAGPQYTTSGELQIINVPTQQKVIAISHIPMNLGICIKAQQLLKFETILTTLLEQKKNT